MAAKLQQDLFKANTMALIDNISDLVTEISTSGARDDADVDKVAAVSDAVSVVGATELMEMFLLKEEEVWSKIVNRDVDFFRLDLPKIFDGVEFDVVTLTLPAAVFHELKEGEHDDLFKSEDDWPIKQADVDVLWMYCDKLLRNAYNYCLANEAIVKKVIEASNKKVEAVNKVRANKKIALLPLKRHINADLYKAHVEAFTAANAKK